MCNAHALQWMDANDFGSLGVTTLGSCSVSDGEMERDVARWSGAASAVAWVYGLEFCVMTQR